MTEHLTGYRVTFVNLFGREDEGMDSPRPRIDEIEIPVIQRDYAQGRELEAVTHIRLTFLEALRDALRGEAPISLDFVYGDVSDGVFRPLDGQQRLTTLFLLHWYVAQCAHIDLLHEKWTRFSYATRHSSRRFVEELVRTKVPADRSEPIGHWIADQTWFHYGWEHDPTIRSMLVVLDAIEVLFDDFEPSTLWQALSSAEASPISFYLLPIEEMGQGDTLYIKMNSRGKPLTPFENFKALFERAVAHTEHGDEIAHKIDGVWSDVMWPFRGADNIVDDEFLKYFTFLIDVCEWKGGFTGEGRLIHRAERVMGGSHDNSKASLDFFVEALDTWVGVQTDDYFGQLFRPPGSMKFGDARPTLFLPENLTGVNLFALACDNYGDMRGPRARAFPLGLTVLLYAVISHRLRQTPQFLPRLRVLRNLLEASENEIRADRMHRILADVDQFLLSGDVWQLKSFNQAQVEDELRKAEFLATHPDSTDAVHALEDHRVLRGTLTAIELDTERLTDRASAFERIFSEPSSWQALTGALLTEGDYFRRTWNLSYYFGSPRIEGRWRILLTAPGRVEVAETRPAWSRMLDAVAAAPGELTDLYEGQMTDWLAERVEEGRFDWRYHMVSYPEIREGDSGLYVTEHGTLGFELCALNRTQLNSNYRDPYLYAIHRISGVAHAVQNPVFFGYQYHPRWLRITGSEVALRCRNHGFDIRCPDQEKEVLAALQGIEGSVSATDGHVVWWAPQDDDPESVTDTVDRVVVGGEIMRRLVALVEGAGR